MLPDPTVEVIAFLKDRSVPCPRCTYDLRDNQSASCPECGEPLVLKIGSPRQRFGWLFLAMAPGCFSGVAALFVLIPICVGLWLHLPKGQRMPWPGVCADIFGFLSAFSLILLYRQRHAILAWSTRRQALFTAAIWAVHITALGLGILAMNMIK